MSTDALLDVFSLPHLLRRLRPGGRRGVATQLRLLLLIITLNTVGGVAYAQEPEPFEVVGQWGDPITITTGEVGIHAIVLTTGKVLLYSSGSNATLWDPTDPTDPTDGTFTPNPAPNNVFCSGHCSLADGRVLVIGQKVNANIFDPIAGTSGTWSEVASMARERFYPTCTSLPDGRVLATSGSGKGGGGKNLHEVYDPSTDTWEQLNNATLRLPLYPTMFVLPSGLVFNAGPKQTTRTLDVAAQTWEVVGDSIYGSRLESPAVSLQPGKILIAGGDQPATTIAEIIDLTAMDPMNPTWRVTNPMIHARHNHNATLLPDGKVLVTGGNNQAGPVLAAEMFDPHPSLERWTEMASMTNPRLYHSTAFLLPDGRVVVTGTDDDDTLEIYSPPYLFNDEGAIVDSARPTISAPNTIEYATPFSITVGTVATSSIVSVALIRPSAVTHSFNQDQLFVPLVFEQVSGSMLDVQAPEDANLAPPGYYMLFIVDDQGVPSIAPFVKVGPAVTASIVSPTGGSTVSGTVTVQVDATATEALTVTMSIDSGASSPMNFNSITGFYEDLWVTGTDGTHTIDAQAATVSGGTATATQVSVTVDNTKAATGTIIGTVTEFSSGSALAGATVFISGQLKTTTNTSGNYTIIDVPAGTHTVKAKAKGFVSASEEVTVFEGGAAEVTDFALKPR